MMTLHKDVVKKAQAEIDAVVGIERLPTSKDRLHLPYVDCILKEVLRYVYISKTLRVMKLNNLTYSINPPVPPGMLFYVRLTIKT